MRPVTQQCRFIDYGNWYYIVSHILESRNVTEMASRHSSHDKYLQLWGVDLFAASNHLRLNQPTLTTTV